MWKSSLAFSFGSIFLVQSLLAQTFSEDTLSLSLNRAGSTITARVNLNCPSAGVQGLSFALCHSPGDVLLTKAVEGADILTVQQGNPAAFIVIRSGDTPGAGFVTFSCVFDFSGLFVFGAGNNEVLVLTYSVRPGGTGDSITFCEAGDPAVGIHVVREGQSFLPGIFAAGNIVRAPTDAEAVKGIGPDPSLASVPLSLSTASPGLTGGTFVVCHDPNILKFKEVTPAPELAPYEPSLSAPADFGTGFQVSLSLKTPLPKVPDLPALLVNYEIKGAVNTYSPIAFCKKDSATTFLRFGATSYETQTVDGSVKVTAGGATYSLPALTVGPELDPIPVTVSTVLSIPTGYGVLAFDTVFSFDPELLEVVDEPSVEAYRGPDLAAFLTGKTPTSEERRKEIGHFIYRVTINRSQLLNTRDIPSYPLFSLAKCRLARKRITLPDGSTGKVAGVSIPLEFKDFKIPAGGVISNVYQTFSAGVQKETKPALQDGSIAIGPAGIVFKAPSVEAEVVEPKEVTISISSSVGDIVALKYTVSHSGPLLSILEAKEAADLIGKNPISSVFDLKPDHFTHTIVFDGSNPLGPVSEFRLANVTYKPSDTAVAGQSSPLEFSVQASLRPVVAISSGGNLFGVLPATNLDGILRLKEDPTLATYRVSSGRALPGDLFVASISLDAGFEGILGLQGSLCHDPSLADLDSAYIGGFQNGEDSPHLSPILKTLKNGDPVDFHVVNTGINQTTGERGVIFAMLTSLDLSIGLPGGLDIEIFRVGYRMKGSFGDVMPLRFCVLGTDSTPPGPLIENELTSSKGGGVSAPVLRFINGQVPVATDDLAPAISPQATPGSLQAVAVTEFGWRWGLTSGSTLARHYKEDGTPFGRDIPLLPTPRRIASGGEGWVWVSLPGQVAILRFDKLERFVKLGGEPQGIAVDRDRNVWVAVAGQEGRLVKIGKDGRILRQVSLPSEGREPREVLIDEEGAIWVAYEGLSAMSRAAPDGALVRPVAAHLRSIHPAGLATDGRGTIWASDAGDRSLLAYDLGGQEVRRIPLDAEPTDISLDGKGDVWTVLKGLQGSDQLVRIRPATQAVTPLGPSSTYHGDRTGLLSLRLLVPEEDSDRDGLPNLVEIRNGLDPLDAADPPGAVKVPPVKDLAAKVASTHLGSPGGGGLGGAASENTAAVIWRNQGPYTKHSVSVEGTLVAPAVPGDRTSMDLVNLPPGPSTVTFVSFVNNDASPRVTTSIQFGPGTAVRTMEMEGVEPADLAVDEVRAQLYILDGKKNQVVVVREDFGGSSTIALPKPIGNSTGVLTGIAYTAEGNKGIGSLYVLDGASGKYQEVSLAGVSLGGPWDIPYDRQGKSVHFSGLATGNYLGTPSIFSIARGPQNDDIIVFNRTSPDPASRLAHPLAMPGMPSFTLGGIAYHPGSGPGAERLWIPTGLEGDALARLVLEVPLDGSRSQGKVLMSVFDQPEGTPRVMGIDISPTKGDLYVTTSDRRLHLLSDFGVVRGAELAPRIAGAGIGSSGPAAGPLAGGTEMWVEGENFGSDLKDLRVIIGKSTAVNVKLERLGGLDRLTVRSPKADVPGFAPLFLFRTRALDFLPAGFYYCGVTGGPDCNSNGIPDSCDIALGILKDLDGNGIPDDCASTSTKFRRGDADSNGLLELTDVLYTLNWAYLNGDPPTCMDAADADDNSLVELTDAIYTLDWLYRDGPNPPAPGPSVCGEDKTPDDLATCTDAACQP